MVGVVSVLENTSRRLDFQGLRLTASQEVNPGSLATGPVHLNLHSLPGLEELRIEFPRSTQILCFVSFFCVASKLQLLPSVGLVI